MPPSEGEQEFDVLSRKGKHEINALAPAPQGSPKEGKHRHGREALRQGEREVPPRRDPNKGALATRDLRGKLPRKKTFEAKEPVEASESDGGQRRPPTQEAWPPDESVW